MFGYVKFNVKYYILSQIFYKKIGWFFVREYVSIFLLFDPWTSEWCEKSSTNFISKHTKSELFWPIPPLKQKSA